MTDGWIIQFPVKDKVTETHDPRVELINHLVALKQVAMIWQLLIIDKHKTFLFQEDEVYMYAIEKLPIVPAVVDIA